MRKYDIQEIDDLRRVVENKYLYGSYNGGSGMSRSYYAEEKTVYVEEVVRTHMLAGHSAGDLLASEQQTQILDHQSGGAEQT